VELGRTDEAQAVLDLHERLARDQDHRPFLVSAAWLTGVIAGAERDSGRARMAFDRSLELCDDRTPRFDQALVRYHFGRFLRRRGERRKAALLLQEARLRASGLRAGPLVGRCDEELAACGVVATEPAGPAAPAALALTPQEQVVAALVCAGHSNRDIAAKLVLSPKTVGYHLSNVYMKLDVHSRVQLAQALSEPSPTPR
jgi:DNA-binding CsgD family transcriptional regulator